MTEQLPWDELAGQHLTDMFIRLDPLWFELCFTRRKEVGIRAYWQEVADLLSPCSKYWLNEQVKLDFAGEGMERAIAALPVQTVAWDDSAGILDVFLEIVGGKDIRDCELALSERMTKLRIPYDEKDVSFFASVGINVAERVTQVPSSPGPSSSQSTDGHKNYKVSHLAAFLVSSIVGP